MLFRCHKCRNFTMSWDARAGSFLCLMIGCFASKDQPPGVSRREIDGGKADRAIQEWIEADVDFGSRWDFI